MAIDPHFEDLMAERHDAVMCELRSIKESNTDYGNRIRSLEKSVAVLLWAYGLGGGIIAMLAYKLGWG